MWYTLNAGNSDCTFTSDNTINQEAWKSLGNGTVIIKFYANDSEGYIGFAEVTIRKDIIAPDITIDVPDPFEVFGNIPPIVNIEINEPNLDTTWYMLYNESIATDNHTFTGIIEQAV